MSTRRLAALFATLLVLALSLSACGQAAQAPAVVEPAAPVAVQVPIAEAPATDLRAVVSDYFASIPEGYSAITKVEDLKELIASASPLIIDVREASEFAEGHIAGSTNIPLRTLAQNLERIPTDQPVVLTCASGLRASYATSALQLLGYTNVRDFYPSYKGWTAAGEPVSTEPAAELAVVGAPDVDPTVFAAVDGFLSGLPEGYFNIGTVEALQELIDTGNVTLVDVREPSEFAEGRIPGAVNIPLRTIGASLDQIPTDQPAVMTCASGLRCSLSILPLHILGYSNVRSFTPSFKGWSAAGLEIEQ